MDNQVSRIGLDDRGSGRGTEHVGKVGTLEVNCHGYMSQFTFKIIAQLTTLMAVMAAKYGAPVYLRKQELVSRLMRQLIAHSIDPPTIPIRPAVPLCASKVSGGAIALTARISSCFAAISFSTWAEGIYDVTQ